MLTIHDHINDTPLIVYEDLYTSSLRETITHYDSLIDAYISILANNNLQSFWAMATIKKADYEQRKINTEQILNGLK